MSIANLYPPQTILTRKQPKDDNLDKVVVTGINSGIIVESLIEFSGPVQLEVRDIRAEYHADIPEDKQEDHEAYVDRGQSVEQRFAAEARKYDEEHPEIKHRKPGQTRVEAAEEAKADVAASKAKKKPVAKAKPE